MLNVTFCLNDCFCISESGFSALNFLVLETEDEMGNMHEKTFYVIWIRAKF